MGSLSAANQKTNVPAYQDDEVLHRRRIAEWAVQVMQGKLNNTGSVTLTTGVTATTVIDARVGINSFIGFTARTANAASETGAGTMYLSASAMGDGQFIITHANSASNDRIFTYCVLG